MIHPTETETMACPNCGSLSVCGLCGFDPMPDAVAAEFEDATAAQDYAGGDDGYDDDGEVMG